MEGKPQETAAAKAGMSVRSARKWGSGPLPSATKPEHWWRTRPDPFDGVWEDEIEPLLRNDPAGKLKRITSNQMLPICTRVKPPDAPNRGIRAWLATVVEKTRRNASANPILASILPASSALLILAVIRAILIT